MTSTQDPWKSAQHLASDVPGRSLEQRMEALGEANRIRGNRAQLKRDLKAGRKSIIDILLYPPEYVETMKVFDLMLACPNYGRVKVNKILRECRISPARPIERMTLRERTEVASKLRQ